MLEQHLQTARAVAHELASLPIVAVAIDALRGVAAGVQVALEGLPWYADAAALAHRVTLAQVAVALVLTRVLVFLARAARSREGLSRYVMRQIFVFVRTTFPFSIIHAAVQRSKTAKMDEELLSKDRADRKREIPEQGMARDQLIAYLKKQKERDKGWDKGRTCGYVYHGAPDHIKLMNEVYAMFSQSNPLHVTAFPAVIEMEQEVVRMTANMLNGDKNVCGTMTSGGTESLLMACKVYRDLARERGVAVPEILMPTSGHAAFEKAAHYFGMKVTHFDVDKVTKRGDVRSMKRLFNKNVCMIVGSAPGYPHGVIDPIEEMSEFAYRKGVPFHVDGCLGGFIVPWLEKLGYPIPKFDFRLRGVTSMSADLHKYGFSAKGCSCILYRNHDLLKRQFFAYADWPGGLFVSPSFMGSRSGAMIATAWAALVAHGKNGYMNVARHIKQTADKLMEGINAIEGLRVIGKPDATIFAFESVDKRVDIFQVSQALEAKDIVIEKQQLPNALHYTVTNRHNEESTQYFLNALRDSVNEVRENPKKFATGMAPVYGFATKLPDREGLENFLVEALDKMSTY